MNLLNMMIAEGRISEKQLLEKMTIDQYYSELNAYINMKKKEAEQMEKAMEKNKR